MLQSLKPQLGIQPVWDDNPVGIPAPVFYTVLNEGIGDVSYDIAGGLPGEHTNITNFGGGIKCASTSGIINFGNNLDQLGHFTAMVDFTINADSGGTYRYMMCKGIDFIMYHSAAQLLGLRYQTSGDNEDTTNWDIGGTYTLPIGTRLTITYVWDGTNIIAYRDGNNIRSHGCSGATIDSNADSFCLCNRSSDSARSAYITVYRAAVWEAVLTPTQVQFEYSNPYYAWDYLDDSLIAIIAAQVAAGGLSIPNAMKAVMF